MTDMDKMMIEKVARAIFDEEYSDGRPWPMVEPPWGVCIKAARAAIRAYNPDDRLSQEVAELKHDLKRQMTIANTQCNEVDRLREALEEARSYVEGYAQQNAETGTLLQAKLIQLLTKIDSALSPLPQGDG